MNTGSRLLYQWYEAYPIDQEVDDYLLSRVNSFHYRLRFANTRHSLTCRSLSFRRPIVM